MGFEEIAPASTETPHHLHHDDDEVTTTRWCSFSVANSASKLVMNSVPADLAHAYLCRAILRILLKTTEEPGRAFVYLHSGEAGKLFEEMRRMKAPIARIAESAAAQLYRGYGWEVVGPPQFLA